MLHHLKTLPKWYALACSGEKTAEVRKLDRDFRAGDILELHEYDGEKLTGRSIKVIVTHVLTDSEYIREGYAMLSFQRCSNGARIAIEIWADLYNKYCEARREIELLKEALRV